MLRLIKMQLYRHTRKPWSLLVIVLTILLTSWLSASWFRSITSYNSFNNKYGDMEPYKVSLAILDDRRPDLTTVDEVYDEFMKTQQPFLYSITFSNYIRGLVVCMGLITAAYFICRDVSEDSIKSVLIAGSSRTQLFIWLVLVYYAVTALITTVSMALLRGLWQVDLNNFPREYVFRTQSVFLLLTMAIMSVPMLIAFVFKNPIITAGLSLIFNFLSLVISVVVKPAALLPYLPFAGLNMVEKGWVMDAQPGVFNSYIVSSIIIIVLCIAASYLVFRRKEAK